MVVGHAALNYDFAVPDKVQVLLRVVFLALLSDDGIKQLLRMIWRDERVLFAVD